MAVFNTPCSIALSRNFIMHAGSSAFVISSFSAHRTQKGQNYDSGTASASGHSHMHYTTLPIHGFPFPRAWFPVSISKYQFSTGKLFAGGRSWPHVDCGRLLERSAFALVIGPPVGSN